MTRLLLAALLALLPAAADAAPLRGAPIISVTAAGLAAGATPTASVVCQGLGTCAINLGIPAGAAGGPPSLAIGTVTSLAAGATPTASVSGGSGSYTLSLGLPAGAAGQGFNYRGAWVASRAYSPYDVLLGTDGNLYVVQTAFTSSSTFSTTNLGLLLQNLTPSTAGSGIAITGNVISALPGAGTAALPYVPNNFYNPLISTAATATELSASGSYVWSCLPITLRQTFNVVNFAVELDNSSSGSISIVAGIYPDNGHGAPDGSPPIVTLNSTTIASGSNAVFISAVTSQGVMNALQTYWECQIHSYSGTTGQTWTGVGAGPVNTYEQGAPLTQGATSGPRMTAGRVATALTTMPTAPPSSFPTTARQNSILPVLWVGAPSS